MGISDNSANTLSFSTGVNHSRNYNIINLTSLCCFPTNKTTDRYFVSTSLNMAICCIYRNIFQIKILYVSRMTYPKKT